MVRIIVILIICIVNLSACTAKFTPWCRHKAVYAAIVVGEKYPVRIVLGKSTARGMHVQAQYFDGEWKWLTVNDFGEITESDQDGFYPFETWDINEYYTSRFGILTNIAGYGSMITNSYGEGENDNSMQTMSR